MAYVLKIKYDNNLRRLTVKKEDLESDSFSFAYLEIRIRELFQLPAGMPLAVTYTDDENDVVTMGNDEELKDALVGQALNPLRIHVTLVKVKRNDKAELGKIVDLEKADVILKRLLKTFSSTPETLKHAFQPYEPLFEGVTSPSQIPGLVENVLQKIVSQVSTAVKNGAAAAAAAAPSDFGASTPATPPALPGVSQGFQFGDFAAGVGGACSFESADSENIGPVHHGVTCDICGDNPIIGIRWKSMEKVDYDLCNSCFEKNGTEKEYVKIEQPKFRPRHMHGRRHLREMTPSFPRMGSPPPMGPPPPAGLPFPPMGLPFPQIGSHGPYHGHFHGGRHFFGHGGRNHCMQSSYAGGDKLYARFVSDVTIFDGTEIAPGTQFVKIWRLRNSGAAPWPANTTLVFVGGDELGPVTTVPLEIPEQGLNPEEEMEASVDMVAPEKLGRYVSHWRLASPAGPKFGQRLSVIIQVVPKATLDQPAEVIGMDDAVALETESAVDTVCQLPAAELSAGKKVIELFNFEKFEVQLTSQEKKEEFQKTDVPSTSQSGELGDLISLIQSSDITEKATENATPIPKLDAGVEPEKMVELTISDATPAAVKKNITYSIIDAIKDGGPVTYPQIDDVVIVAAPAPAVGDAVPAEEDISTTRALLAKLEAMGFTDGKLNYELLEKNGFDLRKTLDDLCAAEEWDPILEELEEMGFYDTVMNRRLMFKNNGSVKRVVKELVQMYRDLQGKREKVE